MGPLSIRVKTLASENYEIRIDPDCSVPALKQHVFQETGVEADRQRLIFQGKVLKNDQSVSAYSIGDGMTIHLVERPPHLPPLSSTSSSPSSHPRTGITPSPAALSSFLFPFRPPSSFSASTSSAGAISSSSSSSNSSHSFISPSLRTPQRVELPLRRRRGESERGASNFVMVTRARGGLMSRLLGFDSEGVAGRPIGVHLRPPPSMGESEDVMQRSRTQNNRDRLASRRGNGHVALLDRMERMVTELEQWGRTYQDQGQENLEQSRFALHNAAESLETITNRLRSLERAAQPSALRHTLVTTLVEAIGTIFRDLDSLARPDLDEDDEDTGVRSQVSAVIRMIMPTASETMEWFPVRRGRSGETTRRPNEGESEAVPESSYSISRAPRRGDGSESLSSAESIYGLVSALFGRSNSQHGRAEQLAGTARRQADGRGGRRRTGLRQRNGPAAQDARQQQGSRKRTRADRESGRSSNSRSAMRNALSSSSSSTPSSSSSIPPPVATASQSSEPMSTSSSSNSSTRASSARIAVEQGSFNKNCGALKRSKHN